MAGDWIKMRTDLYRDPKVCVIADLLLDPESDLARHVNQNCQRDMTVTRNVLRNVTVGALLTVWGIMRMRGKRTSDDLMVRNASLSVIDDVADVPGFGGAMNAVGWAIETPEGLVFPRFFEEFNTEPDAEASAKNAERQRRWRAKHRENRNVVRNVMGASQSNVREEKRREEKSNNKTPLSPFDLWWKLYPKKSGKEEARRAFSKALKRLRDSGMTTEQATERLSERASAFASTPKANGRYCWNPATWLNQGHYDDDPATWIRSDEEPLKPAQTQREFINPKDYH